MVTSPIHIVDSKLTFGISHLNSPYIIYMDMKNTPSTGCVWKKLGVIGGMVAVHVAGIYIYGAAFGDVSGLNEFYHIRL